MQIGIRNKELDIEFDGSMQGFRMNVREWDGNEWYPVNGFTWDIQRIGQTQFESLCDLASELFSEAVEAETMAELLNVPMRFSDDADCRDCDYFGNYQEMQEIDGEYLCLDCAELTNA